MDVEEFVPLDLSVYYAQEGRVGRLASLTGPLTVDTGGFLPLEQRLPYTIQFENDSASPTHTSEIRVVTELDEDLDVNSFRLGDLKIGEINVHVPADRSLFQGEFDFSEAKGFTSETGGESTVTGIEDGNSTLRVFLPYGSSRSWSLIFPSCRAFWRSLSSTAAETASSAFS